MSEFDDPDLRQELGRLSGPYPDNNAAFAAWQQRVGYARRRRAVVWTTGLALSLLVGTVGVAALNSPGRHTLVPGKSADSSADVSISTTTEADASSTVESTEPETSDPTTLAADTTPSSEAIDTSVPETAVEATVAAGSGSNRGSSKQHGTPTSATPVSPVGSATFGSVGGSITVRRDGDKLTIVQVNPASGFHSDESKDSGGRVGVTFDSNDHRSSITVRIVNGVITPNVQENPKDHQGSTPDSTHDSKPDSTDEGGHGSGNN